MDAKLVKMMARKREEKEREKKRGEKTSESTMHGVRVQLIDLLVNTCAERRPLVEGLVHRVPMNEQGEQ